ncbi:MAG: F0F1 ATP synthase subunit delta [Micrococcales bacterium]
MASSTRQSLAAAKANLGSKLESANLEVANDLFSVAASVAGSAQLRSLLSDPSAELKAKSGAVSAVFAKRVSADAIELVTALVALRWSKGSDLVAAIEQFAVQVVSANAAKAKNLEAVESELFAFIEAIDNNSELQFALASKQATDEAKVALVDGLIKGASKEASVLIRQAVLAARKVRASLVLNQFAKWVSAYAARLVATVTVAQPLTASQASQLEETLAKQYHAAIKLNVQVDSSIIGGVVVQIGEEIIDGSLASRLNQARLQLA